MIRREPARRPPKPLVAGGAARYTVTMIIGVSKRVDVPPGAQPAVAALGRLVRAAVRLFVVAVLVTWLLYYVIPGMFGAGG